MIQVDDQGNNSIVVVAGANYEVTPEEIDNALAGFPANAWLLAQNETSAVAHAIRRAKQQGRPVAFNPCADGSPSFGLSARTSRPVVRQ